MTYDVYLEANDSSPDVLVSNDQTTTSHNPGTLAEGMHYYWKIVAKDAHGVTTTGAVWDFTTAQANSAPYVPSSPSPADGATVYSPTLDGATVLLFVVGLSWTGGDPDGDTVTYDVYFESNDSSPDVLLRDDHGATATFATVGSGHHYYWQIVATDSHGAATTGPVWDFTTAHANSAPYVPSSPSPGDGATDVPINLFNLFGLSWTGGDPDGDTVTYDVYFEANDSSPDVLVANDLDSPHAPQTGASGMHYYWKIVAKDEHGVTTAGPVWDFITTDWP